MLTKHRAMSLVLGILILMSHPLSGQQSYVSRYDLYTGYAFLDSPRIGLFENGFHTQVGIRPKTWYSVGFDYSVTAGDLTITPNLLPLALETQLGYQLKGLMALGAIPTTYALTVPAHSVTHSIAVGPQFSYRHFSRATFFIRPSLGAIREGATPTPTPKDPVATAIVAQLAPTGHKTDVQGFYGVGGGFDILLSKHFAVRTQADYVYDHLFNDILAKGRWTTRFSIGPCFNFGRNIAGK